MKSIFLILCQIFFSILSGYTQISGLSGDKKFNDFQPLESGGVLPRDFIISLDESYELQKSNSDYNDKKSYVNDFEEFQYASDFYMNVLLRSGDVIFGDTVTEFLNRVKNIILASNPAVRDKIRVYTLRSEEVNAFTSDGGIVIVTTGLLARLHNEAELAFVLCHEVNHYIQKHSIKFYGASERSSSSYGYEYSSNVTSLFKYSRDLEFEADLYGVKLFLKTSYHPSAIQTAFDILAYSEFPNEFILPDPHFFNDASYELPLAYFADTLIVPTANENNDDESATHPNIKKRRIAIQKTMNATFDTIGYYYIVDEGWFNYIRKICKLDLCQTGIDNGNYKTAMLFSYQQLQELPGNLFLEKKMGEALYGYALFGYVETEKKVIIHDTLKPVREQFYQLMNKMPEIEMQILALHYNWMLYRMDTNDYEIKNVCAHLIKRIATKYKTPSDSLVFSGRKSKLYWKNAFLLIPDQEEFIRQFKQIESAPIEKHRNYRSNNSRKFRIYAIGADKVILMEPIYLKHTNLSDESVRFVASGKSKEALADKILNCADKLDLDVEYFDPIEFDSTDTQKFRDMGVISKWFMKALVASSNNINVSNFYHDELLDISNRYQTDFVAWTGIVTYLEPEEFAAGKIIIGILLPPFLPLVIADLTTNNYTYYVTIVANIRTGEIVANYLNESRMTDSDELQEANLYFILQQIKTKLP